MPYLRVKNELPLIPGYASGDIVRFSDAAVAPLNVCTCYINPVQSGSGDPSPSNVRPITGHTELNLVHTGKNLLPFKNGIDFTINGVRFYTSNGNLYLDGTANASISSLSQNFIDNFKFYLPEGTYHFERNNDGYFSMYIKPIGVDANIIANSGTAILTSGTNAYLGMYIVSGMTFSNTLIPCQLELGSSATTYEPYTGSTTTTDLGTTVYGGKLDVVSGVLTIDRTIVDLSTFTLGTLGDVYIWYKAFDNILVPASNSEIGQVISEYYAPIRYNGVSGTPNTIAIRTNAYMYVNTGGNTTPQGNAVYKLATPTTTQLTPQEVKSLLGSNNIYHDCNGDTKVIYIRRNDS